MINKKALVFIMTLMVLILGVSALSATDISNDTSTTTLDDNMESTSSISEIETTSTSTEKIITEDTKDTNKNDKSLKTDNYDSDDEKLETSLTLTVDNEEDMAIVTAGSNYTVAGKLTDEKNTPISNATITITVGETSYTRTTDTTGKYQLNLVAGGAEDYIVVTATYTGNDTYFPTNSDMSFDIEQLEAILELDQISNVASRESMTISGSLKGAYSTGVIADADVIINLDDVEYTAKTNSNGIFTITVTAPKAIGTYIVTATYNGDITYDVAEDETEFDVEIIDSIITVSSTTGVIGEDITFTAHVTDKNGNPITGGNLVFKLNGVSLKVDGTFNSSKDLAPQKLSVINGTVTFTIKADLKLRDAKNLSASYSGTNKYAENTSEVITVQIAKRYVNVTVTTDKSMAKQYETITLIATATDTTKNGKNTTAVAQHGYILFKVNGVTLKDSKGQAIRVKVDENNTATYNYTVPAGMGSVYNNGNLRNYTVEALFQSDIFYPDARDKTIFNVEKSDVNININSVTVNNKTKTITTLTGTITDYMGNKINGTNKIAIKVNGVTLKDKNNKTIYYTVKNGNINLSNITTNINKIKSITLVTGERQAYNKGETTITQITTV
ncbi:Ig-like domain repeat protein [Methanosphaera sp.]